MPADAGPHEQPDQTSEPAPPAASASLAETAEKPATEMEAVTKAQPSSPALAPFYLQLWLAGPCALLLEVSEPGLEKATAPYRLLADILRAAGLPDRPALFADFQWPLTRNPQFDRSAEAASQALIAFVQARLEDQSVVSIGCFGERCALLADADASTPERLFGREEALDGLAPAWFAAGLEQLPSVPSEKIKLWKLLKRVMPRWKERE
ncbi:energy transducer TonB [Halopseudomonas xinjiangensis]|nr:energy transducer TonB [Halopseudomonas xinjiangensis]